MVGTCGERGHRRPRGGRSVDPVGPELVDPEPVNLELVEIVDDDDRVVATVTRAEMRTGRLRHRCVFLVVRRPDGRVLVHQRSPAKDIWPSAWDIAVGGVVTAGEAWDAAAARELAEEVGIEGAALVLARTGRYADADVDEVARVYTVTWDGPGPLRRRRGRGGRVAHPGRAGRAHGPPPLLPRQRGPRRRSAALRP